MNTAIAIIDAKTSGKKLDLADVAIAAGVGALSGGIAATGLGTLAQAGLSAGVSALGDFFGQQNAIRKGERSTYNPLRTLAAGATGFVTSIAGSAVGKKLFSGIEKKGKLMQRMGKIGYRMGKKAANALVRSGTRLVNTARGLTSVVGTLATSRANMLWTSLT